MAAAPSARRRAGGLPGQTAPHAPDELQREGNVPNDPKQQIRDVWSGRAEPSAKPRQRLHSRPDSRGQPGRRIDGGLFARHPNGRALLVWGRTKRDPDTRGSVLHVVKAIVASPLEL